MRKQDLRLKLSALCVLLLILWAAHAAEGIVRVQGRLEQSGKVLSGKERPARPGRDKNGDVRSPAGEGSSDDASPATGSATKPLPDQRRLREIETLEKQCLDEVNRVRQRSGLKPLDFDEELLDVAREYSRRMAEENFFSHIDPEGHNVKQRIEQASIQWKMVGENLAYSNGYVNPVAASLYGWMESPGHRANILDREFRLSAVGAWIAPNGTVYFTEIFLNR